MSNRPITIVHLISNLGVGGAERSLANLVLGMDRKRFTNIVISLQDFGHWGPILQAQGIEVYALNINGVNFCLKLVRLWKFLRQCKPDYLQGWMYHANVLALIIGKLAGIKAIYWNIRCSLMDLSKYRFTTRIIFKLGAILSKFPQAIINNSQESIQQHIRNGYRNTNWRYIPNGYDTQHFKDNEQMYHQFRMEHHLPKDARIIGLIARFDPMKDHATFIQAASILAKWVDNVYFVCAGRHINEDNAFLRDVISEHNIQGRMILLDQVDNMHLLYPALDYLTQTSIFGEGFPNVVAEAMACGVPCFVTDVGDSLQVIGDAGFVIEKQNPQVLAKQWHEVISRQTNTKSRVNPRERIAQFFSLEKTIANYMQCYGTGE